MRALAVDGRAVLLSERSSGDQLGAGSGLLDHLTVRCELTNPLQVVVIAHRKEVAGDRVHLDDVGIDAGQALEDQI